MPLKVQFNKCVFKSVISIGTRCAENIDAKKSRNLCGFGIFLSAFSATGSKRNYAPIFSMGEDLNEYMTVLKAAFVTFLHKS